MAGPLGTDLALHHGRNVIMRKILSRITRMTSMELNGDTQTAEAQLRAANESQRRKFETSTV